MSGIGLQWARVGQTGSIERRCRCSHQKMNDSIENRVQVLRRVPLFRGLSENELHFLAEESSTRVFEVDEVIFYQGESGKTCHIVTQGKVRIFVVGEDGRELSVSLMGPGEIIGEMALFEDVPRSASVQAMEPTETLELHQEILLRALQRSPQLALSLLRAMSARLRHTTEDAESMISLTVSERLLARLWRLAEWAGKRERDGTRIIFPMTQQQLAAMVGTSRESINRALSGLRRQKKVRFEDGWIVLLEDRAR
ncbi:MAG: Crp/Fnr family transcriptional regulator [Anaerolineae bacterium]|nr:Crp/Fnr family transcriptional regulator [Anaerolineae bacterium]